MLLKGQRMGQASLACDLAALLSERDLLRTRPQGRTADLQERLHLISLWRRKKFTAVENMGGDTKTCRRVDTNARYWLQRLGEQQEKYAPDKAGTLLAYAYPDRIARRRQGRQESYLLASGRGVLLPIHDPLSSNEYLVAP
jgi:ATP-dependent helicase HrpB